jgi:hypothetical protein
MERGSRLPAIDPASAAKHQLLARMDNVFDAGHMILIETYRLETDSGGSLPKDVEQR